MKTRYYPNCRIFYKSSMMRYLLFIVLSFALGAFFCNAQEPNSEDLYPDYQEDVFMDMDFEENLLTPVVGKEAQKPVTAYMERVAKGLRHRYTVDLLRNGEVFVVTIPTDELFLPNDTLFSLSASSQLNPLVELMKDPYMYKVVAAIHTDDTGSEGYRRNLAEARIHSLYDWFMDGIDNGSISEDVVFIAFAKGSDEPLKPNDTRDNRKLNRRLEIYFIPGPRMIEKAIQKKLK